MVVDCCYFTAYRHPFSWQQIIPVVNRGTCVCASCLSCYRIW